MFVLVLSIITITIITTIIITTITNRCSSESVRPLRCQQPRERIVSLKILNICILGTGEAPPVRANWALKILNPNPKTLKPWNLNVNP